MYRKILAAVNEHLNSEVTGRYALHMAAASGSKIYFCYVAEKGTPQKSLAQAEEAVKRLFHLAKEMGVAAESVFDTGDPVMKIGALVRSEGIDLVFASTRREDIQRRFYAKTVSQRLVLGLPCSVALVRVVHMGKIRPRKILVPLKARIDHMAERACFAAMLARTFGSALYLLHTSQPVTRFFHGEVQLTYPELERRLPADISRFIELLDQWGVRHEKTLVTGRNGRHITIVAAARRLDLVVMGASERTLLSSLIRGNPVEEVLRHTPCDLIILKARHED